MKAEFIEQIEAFLEGRISREELEKTADTEGVSDLEEQIQWVLDSRTAIEAAGLRDQLAEILPKAQAPATKVKNLRSIRTIMAIAASFLLLLVAYFIFDQNGASNLYAEYEFVDPGLPVLMSQSEDYLLYDALTYFSEENYVIAAEKLQQIRDQYAGSDTLHYYLGASLLYQGNPEAARPPLQKVLGMEASTFKQRAEWLLVLSALKENKSEKIKELLMNILDTPDHEFYQQAEALQKELDE